MRKRVLSEAEEIGEAIPKGAHYIALRIDPKEADNLVLPLMADSGLEEANLVPDGEKAVFLAFNRSEWE